MRGGSLEVKPRGMVYIANSQIGLRPTPQSQEAMAYPQEDWLIFYLHSLVSQLQVVFAPPNH